MPLQSCSKPWRDLVVREDTSSSIHNFTGNNFLETSKLISLKVDLLFKVSLVEEYSVRQWWQCKPEVESGKDRRWSDAYCPTHSQNAEGEAMLIPPHTARMLKVKFHCPTHSQNAETGNLPSWHTYSCGTPIHMSGMSSGWPSRHS